MACFICGFIFSANATPNFPSDGAKLFAAYDCKTSVANTTGGVAEDCLGGILSSVAIRQDAIFFESPSAQAADQAFVRVSSDYPKVIRVSPTSFMVNNP